MNYSTDAIAPVRKTVSVDLSQQRAFELFTASMHLWWPSTHHVGKSPVTQIILEPRVGGRWFTRHEDGSQVTIGHVLSWDPPQSFVASWAINSQWSPDDSMASEVEVLFIAEEAGRTRIELEHRGFEALGAQAGAKMRGDVDRGWPTVLERFRTAAKPE